MKSKGIELIAKERLEQIEKHGWDLSHDADYKRGELIQAALFCIDDTYFQWPWHSPIGIHFREKILNKTPEQRLIVAGAFIAAELDRIEAVK